jgi:perosamine synthetase
MTCFSFYATKTLTTGEGGMITTEEGEWAERCRMMSMHGISKDAYNRYTGEGSWFYEVIEPGYKYNFSDLGAAMGLAQLGKLERMWQRRATIADTYTRAFRHYPELETPSNDPKVEHAWHLYILRLDLNALEIDRAEFIQELIRHNIGVSVHFIPLHVHPYYAQTYGYCPEDFQVAYNQSQRVISLPICSPMTDEDVEDVIEAVTDIVHSHRRKKVYGLEEKKPLR